MTYLILGLFSGAAAALVAIGFVFVNTVIDAYPFHLGALVILDAFIFYELHLRLDNVWLALLLLLLFAVASSLFLSVVVYEPLLGRHFPSLVAGVGLLIIMSEVVRQFFNNGQAISFPDSMRLSGTVTVFDAVISLNRLFVFGVAVVIGVLLDVYFHRTRSGMRMRAIAESRAGAQLCAVNIKHSVRVAFVMSGLAAAAAAIMLGLLQPSLSAELGDTLTITALAAALLGGGLSLRGAILGAIVIGVAQSLAVGYLSSSFSQAVAYVLIVLILLARPHGFFGRAREARA